MIPAFTLRSPYPVEHHQSAESNAPQPLKARSFRTRSEHPCSSRAYALRFFKNRHHFTVTLLGSVTQEVPDSSCDPRIVEPRISKEIPYEAKFFRPSRLRTDFMTMNPANASTLRRSRSRGISLRLMSRYASSTAGLSVRKRKNSLCVGFRLS